MCMCVCGWWDVVGLAAVQRSTVGLDASGHDQIKSDDPSGGSCSIPRKIEQVLTQ